MLDQASIDDACSGLDENIELDALCSHLISSEVLTEWRCGNLRAGKYKGFFLDHYRFTGHLSVQEYTSTFLADDLLTGKQVAIAITPPTIVPLKDGKPEYRVNEVFG